MPEGGGGGGTEKIITVRVAPLRGPTPDPFIYQKRYPFRTPSIDN